MLSCLKGRCSHGADNHLLHFNEGVHQFERTLTTSTYESRNNETRWVSHVSSYIHDVAHAKWRRCESDAGTSSTREQPNHARPVCAGRYGGEAFGAKQGCEAGTEKRSSSSLIGPFWTPRPNADSLQVIEKNGGDDETRTRDLCRDSLAGIGFTTTYKNAGTAKIP